MSDKEPGRGRNSERASGFFGAAMVMTFVFGLMAIAGLIAVMKACNLNEGLINGFAVMAFLMMVIMEAIFIRLLLRSPLGRGEAGERGQAKRATTNDLHAPEPLAFPEPVMSVTDHTTRTLEPSRRDKSTT